MHRKSYKGKKMLVVIAHPDDETFGMGGTLALYAHLGADIHLICTTRGEAGEVDRQKMNGFTSIADLREHELQCAAEILNIKKVHFLGYRDSGMPGSKENDHPDAFINAPKEEAAEKIANLIREIQPDVVLTFDASGGYMHPDHIAAHEATIGGLKLAGDKSFKTKGFSAYKPKRLYFHTIPRTFLKIVVRLMPLFGKDPRRFGKNKDIDLAAILDKNYPTHAKINYRKFASVRDQASACHASQGGDQQSGYLVTWIMRMFSSVETYMRGYPPKTDRKIERDLFTGI